jgi:hypothetical protein
LADQSWAGTSTKARSWTGYDVWTKSRSRDAILFTRPRGVFEKYGGAFARDLAHFVEALPSEVEEHYERRC